MNWYYPCSWVSSLIINKPALNDQSVSFLSDITWSENQAVVCKSFVSITIYDFIFWATIQRQTSNLLRIQAHQSSYQILPQNGKQFPKPSILLLWKKHFSSTRWHEWPRTILFLRVSATSAGLPDVKLASANCLMPKLILILSLNLVSHAYASACFTSHNWGLRR